MKRATWKLLFLPVLFVLLQAGSCSDDDSNPLAEGDEFRATIDLYGTGLEADECIHLFGPGEDFPSGQVCKTGLAPFRTLNLDVRRGSSYVFRAGRNGVILDTQSCTIPTNTSTYFTVEWLGAGLDCGTNW